MSRFDSFVSGATGALLVVAAVGLAALFLRQAERSGYYYALTDCRRYAVTDEHANLCDQIKAKFGERYP